MSELLMKEFEGEINLLDCVLILAKRMRLIVKITIATAILAIVISLILPEIFEGTAKILPPQQKSTSMSMALMSQVSSAVGLAGLGGGAGTPADLYVDMLKSRTVFDAIIDRFQLMELYETETRADARKSLSQVFEAKTEKNSGIITITVEDKEPARAAEMANAFVDELAKLNGRLAITDASQRRLFFEEQLKGSHASLSRAEEALKNFQETTGAIKIDSQAMAIFEGIAALRAQIASKEIQIKVMMTYATPYNREVKQLEEELDGLKEQLRKLEAKDDVYYGNTSIPTDQIPMLGVENLRLLREFKFQETLYELLTKQYESARLDEANNASTVQVIDVATAPDKRAKPSRALIVIGATIVGGFLAVLAAFCAEYRERVSTDPENRERLAKLNEYLSPIMNHRLVAKARRMFARKSAKS
jgi:uncharacterized protein involved in exopolysaccharide biosynthesis